MSLAARIAALAGRIGREVKVKVGADHPGLARAWVCFGHVGSQIVVRSSHNVASVTRTAAGRYRVTFATAMPDANYCWTALARSSTNSGTQRIAIVRSSTDQKTAQFVDISCATTSTSFDDSSEINLAVFR
ncbi:hypothetical protein [Extensimonas vulgaris]|uniref:Uncharacterized protein n=1 Tax=Extensimonas vulgaris TaxID=1031594 RepID=A0A369AHH5_9BURK|nr:hypothetical protein [Extensimonas vulgaris]RCX08611.1 hypothetical protein DFR45_108112 [Extensimonas vulgaris]TWI36226.1 hypothetical protein IP95_02430 [Extensimonas vulgaris]TXD13992.1 hypothetical protein FUT63_10435 [Extensimonas vulgaris]